jgi:CDP-diglyceride synthetase
LLAWLGLGQAGLLMTELGLAWLGLGQAGLLMTEHGLAWLGLSHAGLLMTKHGVPVIYFVILVTGCGEICGSLSGQCGGWAKSMPLNQPKHVVGQVVTSIFVAFTCTLAIPLTPAESDPLLAALTPRDCAALGLPLGVLGTAGDALESLR